MFCGFQLTAPGIIAVLAVAVAEAASRDCPSQCSCYTEDVDCSNRNLTSLGEAMFTWTGAKQLSELTLENNHLVSLPAHIFDPLLRLKTLNLNHNQLQVLEVGVFSKLRKLKFLDMKDNRLTILPVGLFSFQNKLVSLDVSYNLLTTLDVEVMSSLSSLDFLAIKGNPLICDCELQPVVFWSFFILENNAECRYPPQYQGLTWYVLTSDLCTTVPSTFSTSPSTDSSTEIDVVMSTIITDNYTEMLSPNGTQEQNINNVSSSSFNNITIAASTLLCLLVLSIALVVVFWYKKLKVRATSSAAPSSEQEKEMGNIHDYTGIDGHGEYTQTGKKEAESCIIGSDFDTMRYTPGP
jgi:hypothetical protein